MTAVWIVLVVAFIETSPVPQGVISLYPATEETCRRWEKSMTKERAGGGHTVAICVKWPGSGEDA